MFRIVFTKLVQWLIPVWQRQPLLTIICLAGNWALRQAYYVFLTYREDTLYKLGHNSQVCYLRGMLNDSFDRTLRRIEVLDYNFASTVFLYADSENRDEIIDDNSPLFLDADDAGVDFVVVLPSGLFTKGNYATELARMRALINYYKLAGKQYTIQQL